MRYEEFLDLVLSRLRRLDFTDPETRHVDASDVEAAARWATLSIASGWDLDAYTKLNENIATTSVGVREYALPGDFLRFRIARGEYYSGSSHWRQTESTLFLDDNTGGTPVPIRRRHPDEYLRYRTTTNGRPTWFTINGNTIVLDPPPDDNGGDNYILMAEYIVKPGPLNDDDPLLVSHPLAIMAKTISRIAIDRNAVNAAALEAEANNEIQKYINNEARLYQKFRSRYSERGTRHRSR